MMIHSMKRSGLGHVEASLVLVLLQGWAQSCPTLPVPKQPGHPRAKCWAVPVLSQEWRWVLGVGPEQDVAVCYCMGLCFHW